MKYLFCLHLLLILVAPFSVIAQQIMLHKSSDGFLKTSPLSPITNVSFDKNNPNKFIGSESDLFCYAIYYQDAYILVITKPNFSANHLPKELDVYFGENLRTKATVGNRHNGMDQILCSFSREGAIALKNAHFSFIKLVYPSGMTMSYPVKHIISISAHLDQILSQSWQTEKKIASTPEKYSSNAKTTYLPKMCTDIVYEILKTSDEYKKITEGLNQRIVRNGGLYYRLVLWSSPNPESDTNTYSREYKFDLHEVYDDRFPRIASFTFDPNGQVLYMQDELDILNSIPIAFNRDLLVQFNNICE